MSKHHHFSTPEFTALRARAKDKRDKGVAILNAEYQANLRNIAQLEQDLYGSQSSRHKKVSECVEQVIPRDTPFTTVDIMASLEALDPARVWHKRAIVSHICRLREIGLIRRLEKATIHNPAKYVRAESPLKAAPVTEMSMEQVIDAVLTRPMTSTEVVVAVREYGYKSKMTRANFRTHCVDILRKGKAKYLSDGGKWVRK